MSGNELEKFARILLIDMFGKRISFINQEEYSFSEMSAAIFAFFKAQKNAMYYSILVNQENLEKNHRVQIPIPPNIIVGDYKINAYLLNKEDGKIYVKSSIASVSRDEFYDNFNEWSKNWKSLYAILSISITFIFGWLVNLILKRR